MSKPGRTAERDPHIVADQPLHWRIVGNCPCGAPIYALSSEFVIDPNATFINSTPVPPRSYRSCTCPPPGSVRPPGLKSLGGSFKFNLDDDAAAAVVSALTTPLGPTTTGASEPANPLLEPTEEIPSPLTLLSTPRDLGARPEWLTGLITDGATQPVGELPTQPVVATVEKE